MTRDELLEALLIERQCSPWWTTKPDVAVTEADDDLTIARRRREALREAEATERRRRA